MNKNEERAVRDFECPYCHRPKGQKCGYAIGNGFAGICPAHRERLAYCAEKSVEKKPAVKPEKPKIKKSQIWREKDPRRNRLVRVVARGTEGRWWVRTVDEKFLPIGTSLTQLQEKRILGRYEFQREV